MAETAKKQSVCKKVHIRQDGEEFRSAHVGETALEFRFANDKVIRVERKDVPDNVVESAMWHGIAQKIGDAYADAKGNVKAAFEDASAMLEQLSAGNWVTTSKSTGPRIGLLVEAVAAAKEAAGMEFDREAFVESIKGDTERQKSIRANPQVDAHYKRLEAERKTAAAKEAAKAVKDASADDLAAI